MFPRLLFFLILLVLSMALHAQPLTGATTEKGPLLPPDLNLTRASTIIHPDETKTVTLYDATKRQSDVRYFNSNGSWRAHIIYSLDPNGKIKSGLFLDQKEKPGVRSLYRYDDSDRVVEETHYNQAGTLVRRMVYEYGLTDRVLKTVAYDAQSNVIGVWTPTKKGSGGPKIRNRR